MTDAENLGLRRVAALTIAGSDSGGNAGIQADLRAFQTFGVHGCTAITALTAQNPHAVRAVVVADAAFVVAQLDAVFDVYGIAAIKTGMLAVPELIETVADSLMCRSRIPKVVDPVMVATSGVRLLADEALEALCGRLLPLAALITPNLAEAGILTGRPVGTRAERADAAAALAQRYGCAALVKGGHALDGDRAADVFCAGAARHWISTPRIAAPCTTHGTGCSLSAAIAAALACGHDLLDAVVAGKAYVYEAIRTGTPVGEAGAALGAPSNLSWEQVNVEAE